MGREVQGERREKDSYFFSGVIVPCKACYAY